MYCSHCGSFSDAGTRFCKVCGKIGGFVDSPGGALRLAKPAGTAAPRVQRPWHLRTPFLVLVFFLLPPVWVALVLLAPDMRRGIKVSAAIAGGLSLVAIGLAALLIVAPQDAPPVADWFGFSPNREGSIQFGTDLHATSSDVEVVNPTSSFGQGDTLSYVAYLRQPA
ncbi:MAG TPA: zinc ribbon domain-containing protein, partial [Dehalococcoidia bacterium]|nr:zinc ribbon domain-containing protein [Dehalococcoidia bacterium]